MVYENQTELSSKIITTIKKERKTHERAKEEVYSEEMSSTK